MNDTKENTGWASSDAATVGWDVGQAEKLAEFEQASRSRSATARAERESTAEQVEFITELDVSDPGRVYKPLEPKAHNAEIEQDQKEGPELGGGGGSTGWEDQQGTLDAADKDAEIIAVEGQAEQAQIAELAKDDPTAGLNEAELAALQQVMGAMDDSRGHDQEIER